MSIAHTWERLLASDRRNAEDRAEVFVSGEDLVIVVADGAGGTPGGGSASDALVAAVSSELQHGGDSFESLRWEKVFHETDGKLAAHLSGETTGVLVVLGTRGLVGVSAGDSEAWAVGATTTDDLTVHQRRARIGSGRVAPVAFQKAVSRRRPRSRDRWPLQIRSPGRRCRRSARELSCRGGAEAGGARAALVRPIARRLCGRRRETRAAGLSVADAVPMLESATMSPYRTNEDELVRALRERVESMLDPDDAEREPYPFASPDDVATAEAALGFPLPPLLREVYGVANGGIGLSTWRDAEPGQPDHELAPWPERLLPLCDWGCAIWSCLDCRSGDGPIVTSSNGEPLVSTGHTLRPWLSAWLAGADLFEEMFEPGPVHTAINPFTKQPIVIRGQGKPKGTRWP